MPTAGRLVLIDGHALLYRAYHAVPVMLTSRGETTHAVYGFFSTLLKVIAEEKPAHIIVCLDRGTTFRHERYPEYKAHRAKMPDDLRTQVERTKEVLQALHIPTCTAEGFEADDLIGTLARQATAAGLETLIVTGDSDALQLVDEHVHVLVPGKKYAEPVHYDPAAVRERYGFAPRQLIDFKALKGDTSDNIPGVTGIGEKTATDLIQRYGSMEGVYEHLGEVSPERYRRALEEGREQARLSKELATIVTDVPVQLELRPLGGYDRETVVAAFRQLESASLVRRFLELAAPAAAAPPRGQLSLFPDDAAAPPPQARPPTGDYATVQDEAGLEEMLRVLGRGPLAFDTETTSTQPMAAELVGLSLAAAGGRAWYIPLHHRDEAGQLLPGQLDWEIVRARLAPLLGDPAVSKAAHHAKFDTLMLAEAGLEVRGVDFDTMIAAHLVGGRAELPEEVAEAGPAAGRALRSVGLKNLAALYLDVQMRDIAELLGQGKRQRTFDQVPLADAGPYACADADMTLRLRGVFAPQLAAKGMEELFRDVELPLVEVLRDMERAGIALDTAFLQEMSGALLDTLLQLEETIYSAAGHPFNINSTQQLGKVLFEELGLPTDVSHRLKSGGYSTAADVLERLQARTHHPIVEAILRQREVAKLKSTYVDALPLLVNPRTGRVHTSFHQTVTSTGRLSSSDPNLQNIPIRTEEGRKIRRAFVAAPGWLLLSADYSQVELRILAHLAGDPGLLEAFARGEDIHATTAETLFGVPHEQVTSEQRRVAKTVNFGLMYGMGDYGLAARLGIEQSVAAHFIATYFGRYARVKRYFDETLQQGRERGYVATVLGRRRYIPELNSPNRNVQAAAEREAINMPIQGTAADIIKIAMIRLHRALRERGLRSRMLLQVHDELVLEVPREEVETVVPLVQDCMEKAYPLDAPLVVDAHTGATWGDLK